MPGKARTAQHRRMQAKKRKLEEAQKNFDDGLAREQPQIGCLLNLMRDAAATTPPVKDLKRNKASHELEHKQSIQDIAQSQTQVCDFVVECDQALRQMTTAVALHGADVDSSVLSKYQTASQACKAAKASLQQAVSQEHIAWGNMLEASSKLDTGLMMHDAKTNGGEITLQTKPDYCVGCGGLSKNCSTHAKLRQAAVQLSNLLSGCLRLSSPRTEYIFGDREGELQRFSTSLNTKVPCHFITNTPLFATRVTLHPLECDVYVHVQDDEALTCKAVSYRELCSSSPRFQLHYPGVSTFVRAFSPQLLFPR